MMITYKQLFEHCIDQIHSIKHVINNTWVDLDIDLPINTPLEAPHYLATTCINGQRVRISPLCPERNTIDTMKQYAYHIITGDTLFEPMVIYTLTTNSICTVTYNEQVITVSYDDHYYMRTEIEFNKEYIKLYICRTGTYGVRKEEFIFHLLRKSIISANHTMASKHPEWANKIHKLYDVYANPLNDDPYLINRLFYGSNNLWMPTRNVVYAKINEQWQKLDHIEQHDELPDEIKQEYNMAITLNQ